MGAHFFLAGAAAAFFLPFFAILRGEGWEAVEMEAERCTPVRTSASNFRGEWALLRTSLRPQPPMGLTGLV